MKKFLYVIATIAMSIVNAVYIWLAVYLCLCIFAELSGLFRTVGNRTEVYTVTMVGAIIVFVTAKIIKLIKYKKHSRKNVDEISYTYEEPVVLFYDIFSFFETLGKFFKSLFFRIIKLAVLLAAAAVIFNIFNGIDNDSINDAGAWCVLLFLLLTVRFIVLRVKPRSVCNACNSKNCIIFRSSKKGEEYYSNYHETELERKYGDIETVSHVYTYRDVNGNIQSDVCYSTERNLEAIHKIDKFYDKVKFCDYKVSYQCVVCGQKYYSVSKYLVENLKNRAPDSVDCSTLSR